MKSSPLLLPSLLASAAILLASCRDGGVGDEGAAEAEPSARVESGEAPGDVAAGEGAPVIVRAAEGEGGAPIPPPAVQDAPPEGVVVRAPGTDSAEAAGVAEGPVTVRLPGEEAAAGPGVPPGIPAPPGVTPPPGMAPPGEGGVRTLTPEEQQLVIEEILRVRARQQAEGLGRGRVVVNGAWNYTGYSYLSPDPDAAIEARLVAVDITVSGHTEHFDIDDIEIVDGASHISYGSDPHPTLLTLEGGLETQGRFPAPAPRANRWLLIYAFPAHSHSFHLVYWGRQLTPEPVEIADSGLELPHPPAEPQP